MGLKPSASRGRPRMAAEAHEPTVREIFSFIEDGYSTEQAISLSGRSARWLRRILQRSRAGIAPAWIARTWDQLHDQRCDLCTKPVPKGAGVVLMEDSMRFVFCGQGCLAGWIEAEE